MSNTKDDTYLTKPRTIACTESCNTEEEQHMLTRRRFVIVGMSALAVLLTSNAAYALVRHAFTNASDAWTAPEINQLSEKSNLFMPGDRPRKDKTVTCTGVNRAFTDGKSRAYWGCDAGFNFKGPSQKDWPCRDHAFGVDYFSKKAVEKNVWVDQWHDTITGNELRNNEADCGAKGFGAHHLVSFATWDISKFGGIIPATTGSWSLHNASCITFASYGTYYVNDNPNGTIPPDTACAWEGVKAKARITCFSTWTEKVDSDIKLHYCIYICIMLTDKGYTMKKHLDNYGFTFFAESLCAGIKCKCTTTGIDTIIKVLTRNIARMIFKELPNDDLCSSNAKSANAGTSVNKLVYNTLKGHRWSKTFSTASSAAQYLSRALFQVTLNATDEKRYASIIKSSGLAKASAKMYSDRKEKGTLPYPISLPKVKLAIGGKDAVEKTHSITCASNGTAHTPYVYNYGSYKGKLTLSTTGWKVKGGLSPKFTVTDSAGGTYVSKSFIITPKKLPTDVYPPVTVTFIEDYRQSKKLGQTPTSFTRKVDFATRYAVDATTPKKMPDKGCSSWTGWCTDVSCKKPYTTRVLTKDITLYCENIATVSWSLTEQSLLLESRVSQIWSNKACTKSTTLQNMLPAAKKVRWGCDYTFSTPGSIWTEINEVIREIDGEACRDKAGKKALTSPVRITKDTIFYGKWVCDPYDGVRVS